MKERTYEELASELTNYMKNELKLKESTIYVYHLRWRKLEEYMLRNKIDFFTPEICTDYLLGRFGENYTIFSNNDKVIISQIKNLIQFYETGGLQKRHEPFVFDGTIGPYVINNNFIKKKPSDQTILKRASRTN